MAFRFLASPLLLSSPPLARPSPLLFSSSPLLFSSSPLLSSPSPFSSFSRPLSSSPLRLSFPLPLSSSLSPLSQARLLPSLSSFPLPFSRHSSAKAPHSPKPKQQALEREKAKKRAEALKTRQSEPVELDVPLMATPLLLSNLLAVRTVDILKTMIKLGLSPRSSRELLSDDIVDLLCGEYYFIPKRNIYRERVPQWLRYAENGFTEEEMKIPLTPRAPIVTIMGHVNHGKTTLLDSLKGIATAAKEAGGITQVVSSFMVQRGGNSITFLDTPGHAAFTQMRDCSSYASDLVVLVIAADEGVQEQTVESIRIIKDSKKKFIIAATKMDKEGANLDKVSQQLIRHGIFTDRIGGDVITIPVCGPTGKGLDDLCEAILVESENLNLLASVSEPAEAVVLDAEISKSGLAVLLMTRWGTLRKGDHVVVGESYGRIRSLMLAEASGYRAVNEVGPSTPVLIYGLSENPPSPGEPLHCVPSEREAKSFVKEKRDGRVQMLQVQDKEEKLREMEEGRNGSSSSSSSSVSNTLSTEKVPDNVKTVSLIIKSSVAGSAYALRDSILELAEPHEQELSVLVPRCGLGPPNDVDITFAKDSGGMLLCFGIKISDAKRRLCEEENIKLVVGDVIYSILEEVKEYLGSMLAPHEDQVVTGEAKIMQIFSISRSGTTGYIAGCQVTSGMITYNSNSKLIRDGQVVFTGRIGTLRHFKDSVKVVKKGSECGIGLAETEKEKTEDKDLPSTFPIQKGDIIQTYHLTTSPRKLGEKRRVGS